MTGFKAYNCETRQDDDRRQVFCEQARKWRCDGCPFFKQDEKKKDSLLYLHMTIGNEDDADHGRGISWNITELLSRLDLKDRVVATEGLTVRKGVSSVHLNLIYNLFDVHLLTTKREGFGLPVLEAMSAGVPNLVTGYSACKELVEDGRGAEIDIATYVNEPHDEAEGAIVDIGDIAKKLELFDEARRVDRDSEDAVFLEGDLGAHPKDMAEDGRKYAEDLNWDNLIPRWEDLIDRVVGATRSVPPRTEKRQEE